MKQCSKCKEEKLESDFNKKGLRADGSQKYQPYCKACQKIAIRTYYIKNKDSIQDKVYSKRLKYRGQEYKNPNHAYYKVIEYLKDKCCEHCGIADIRVLEFNHLDRRNKEYTIANMLKHNMEWTLIIQEINKCEILCANCHKIETDKQIMSYRHRYIMGL